MISVFMALSVLGGFFAYGHVNYFHSHTLTFWRELTYLGRNFSGGFISW